MFRTRTVVWSGVIDATAGLAIVVAGSAAGLLLRPQVGLPVGLAVGIVGVLVGGTGLSRVTAKLEVYPSKLVWTWMFSRHELALADAVEAALVEPGSPNPGGEWAAFLPGGPAAVAAWWVYGVARDAWKASPNLGAHALVLILRHGPPKRIEPIGSYAATAEDSDAGAARRAIQRCIDDMHRASTHQYQPPPPQRFAR